MPSILNKTCNSRFISTNGNQSLLIRSDRIDLCDEKDIQYLVNLGIKNVIDFRNLKRKERNKFLESYDINFLNIPLPTYKYKKMIFSNSNKCDCFFNYYKKIIKKYKKIGKILNSINNSVDGIVINCSKGRDRTGVISFILELVADYVKESIIEDMAISDKNLDNKDLKFDLNYLQAKERAANLYEWFLKKYKNINLYLKKCKVDPLKLKLKIRKLIYMKTTINYKSCHVWKNSSFIVNRTLCVSNEKIKINYEGDDIEMPKYKYKEVLEFIPISNSMSNDSKMAVCIGLNPALACKEIDTTNKRLSAYLQKDGYSGYYLYNLYPEVASHKENINLEDEENKKGIDYIKSEMYSENIQNAKCIILFFGRTVNLSNEQEGFIKSLIKEKRYVKITTFNGEFIHPGSIGSFELMDLKSDYIKQIEQTFIKIK